MLIISAENQNEENMQEPLFSNVKFRIWWISLHIELQFFGTNKHLFGGMEH